MKFLFIMDPFESLNLETETSLLLMEELLRREQEVYWIQPENLDLVHGQPMGGVSAVRGLHPLELAGQVYTELDEFDAVLVRKDPPFDSSYLHLTLVLDHLDPRVVQFNEVKALRNFNEKLLPLRWPEFTPPTLISMDADRLAGFVLEHRHAVLKPLDDCSGRGILKISRDAKGNFRKQINEALLNTKGQLRYLVAQKYLPAVKNGDKRVYLVNGNAVGLVNRIPQSGSFLANIHQGAKCIPAQLSARERHMIGTIAPFLIGHGIFLAGADFIGGYLTELNITSPSAIRQINEVSGERVEVRIVDAMQERMTAKQCCQCWCIKAA